MQVDPVELELMRNLFEAAAEEMGITLQRASFSANIKERRDFSCALFAPDGELLAQAAHIPVHLGSMPASVEAVLRQGSGAPNRTPTRLGTPANAKERVWGPRLGALHAGDVAIVNDPFCGGTHLPDITLVSPIYVDGQLAGYAANRAHHADVGGISPGSMTLSRHIDDEGIRIEPQLLYRRGRRNEDLLKRILSAARTPQERLGDIDAQLAANAVGINAFRRIVGQRGLADVLRYGRALLDYAQSFMARAIAALPRGRWSFEDLMDDDGVGSGPVRIHALVRIEGEQAVVDLTDSADQVPGCINCPEAVTRSAVYYCFACLLEEQVPYNGGCFRNIQIITRPGSIVAAQYPAALVAGNTETSQRIVDVVLGALAQAVPHRIQAASCGTMSSVALGGSKWTYYETVGGGSGGGPGWAGESAVQCHMTNTLNTPAEAIEMQYPLRVRRFERALGTGGRGEYRGGDGIVRELEALDDCEGTVLSDRRETAPYGLAGGQPGSPGSNAIVETAGATTPLAGKARFLLRRGQILRIVTPGGGSWGP